MRTKITSLLFFSSLVAILFSGTGFIDDEAALKKKAADDFKKCITGTEFLSSDDLHWTGSIASCTPGKVPGDVYARFLLRLNYFRRLAGIHDDIVIDSSWNKYAQAAALVMYANDLLTHEPYPALKCYSKDADEGAGTSNLSTFDPKYTYELLSDEVEDGDESNSDCGHRRWILYSGLTKVGLGITNETYALRVFSDNENDTASYHGKVPEYFAYPFKGYIPYQVVYQKWSFTIPSGADFTNAVVNINAGGKHLPCAVISRNENLYGDPALVWEVPQLKQDFDYNYYDMAEKKSAFKSLGLLDAKVTVTITGIKVDGVEKTYTYSFTIFDPEDQ